LWRFKTVDSVSVDGGSMAKLGHKQSLNSHYFGKAEKPGKYHKNPNKMAKNWPFFISFRFF